MKLKSAARIISAVTIAIFPFIAFANPTVTKCPSPDAIRLERFDNAYLASADMGWTAFQPSGHYHTGIMWSFTIYHIQANDKEDAIEKANESLSTIKDPLGPFHGDQGWYCTYAFDNEYTAMMVMVSDQ